jgi:hypothetical protein
MSSPSFGRRAKNALIFGTAGALLGRNRSSAGIGALLGATFAPVRGGGRRSKTSKSKNWVQNALKKSKHGVFKSKAMRAKMTTKAFAREVVKHPESYSLKTRRQAQLFRNINRKNK